MTFAVIKTGGKQYKVAEGDTLVVEKLEHEGLPAQAGDSVTFDDVLLVANPEKSQDDLGASGEIKVGKPFVTGAKVTAKVLEEGKGKKKMVFRYKAKTRQHKKKGHRQPFTKVQITKISA